MLQVKELVKRYGNLVALKNFTAQFEAGCINVIIGPSGCGKTSLFNCISGLEPFEHGRIALGDEVIVDYQGHKSPRLKEIGYVLQGFSLFAHLTVLENLMVAPRLVMKQPKPLVEAQALAMLEKMQIADKKDAYPNQLSGGQQQRTAIARAIMMSPKVLLLDEPTNALDPQLVLSLERTLKALVAEGLTLVISTHHLAFAKRIADYSLFMHQGELLAHSPGSQLLDNPSHPEIQKFIHEEEDAVGLA